MEIKILSQTHFEKFNELALLHGSIFNSLTWLKIYGKSITVYGIFNNDNKLIGGFHLYKGKQAKILSHINNPPFTPHIGLFYDNQASNRANSLSFEKNILSCVADFLEKESYHLLTIALPTTCTDVQPFIWKKFKAIPNYTYQLNLEFTELEILKNLASDKRNSINKAEKDKVTIKQNAGNHIIKQLVENTYSRKSKLLNDAIVSAILNEFADAQNSFSFVAYVEEKAAAMSFCIYDSTTAYYLLGGYDAGNKHQGAGVLALWNCILHAKKIGLKKFDFEGSMIPQVEKYFRGFGGELVPYFTLNKASLPLELALKFIKREAF
ncbi:MAG: GNAT family N-acetyltransferase [Bacteroidetes bacterium]|nr:GNAT family N-acetyltransferase [Bacteroidota bacterium]